MKSKIFMISIAVVVLVGLPSSFALMNYSGLCVPRMEYLSERDKIRIAVTQLLANMRPSERTYTERNGQVELIELVAQNGSPYADVESFMEANPDCCHVRMHLESLGHSPGAFDRISGRFSGYVIIRYRAGREPSSDMTQAHVAVTNCGATWDGI